MGSLFLVTNHGEMSAAEMFREFKRDKISPVVVLKKDEKTTVLLFSDSKTCKSFARRNLPKDWIFGNLVAEEEDFAYLKERGWETLRFTVPRRLREEEGELTIEILELRRDIVVQRG